MFGLLGLSYSGMWEPYLWAKPVGCEILQIISIGVITVALVERFIKPKKTIYIFFSLITLLIHYLVTIGLHPQPFPFVQFSFSGDWQPNDFPMFPWISVFFAGIFAYYNKNYINLTMSIACLPLAFIASLIGQSHGKILDKYYFSLGFFLYSYTFLFWAF